MFIAERFELFDREIFLRVQLPRPTPGQLHGHFLRILPSPTLQVGGMVLLALLGLVTLAFVFLTMRSSALLRFLALFAGVEVTIRHHGVSIKFRQRLAFAAIFAGFLYNAPPSSRRIWRLPNSAASASWVRAGAD